MSAHLPTTRSPDTQRYIEGVKQWAARYLEVYKEQVGRPGADLDLDSTLAHLNKAKRAPDHVRPEIEERQDSSRPEEHTHNQAEQPGASAETQSLGNTRQCDRQKPEPWPSDSKRPSMLAAALTLARKGHPVFPLYEPAGTGCSCDDPRCEHVGKHPRCAHGFKDATTDEEQIREWWASWPNANIGMPTGQQAGILALDVDPRHHGVESFYRLQEEHGRLPETAQNRTGGGGFHLFFAYPSNGARIKSKNDFRPGIDIKADGGFVVMPPSRHQDGRRYSLEVNAPLACLPDEYLTLILEAQAKGKSTEPKERGQKIRKGARNDYLTRMAGSLRRTGASPESLQAMLLQVNKNDCDPPLSDEEVKRIAASIGRYAVGEERSAPMLHTCSLADVTPTAVEWLWHPYIPLGKVTCVEGDPGLGKSWLLLAIAAIVSRGWALPGAEPTNPAKVLLMTAEDGLADTVRPRFDALGGDPAMVEAVPFIQDENTGRSLTLDEAGCLLLETKIAEVKPALVIIDPLFAYTGATVDIHKANETRAILARLAAIADRYHCAVVFLRHLTKGGRDKSIYRGVGSIDITAACRSVLLVGADPNDQENRAIVQVKINLAPSGQPVGYSLREGVFTWAGHTDLTAAAILAPEDEEKAASIEHAKDLLEDQLQLGPVLRSKIREQWRGSQSTLYRAKKALKIESIRNGFQGPAYWALPSPNDAQPSQKPEAENVGEKVGDGDNPPKRTPAEKVEGKREAKYKIDPPLSHIYQPLKNMASEKVEKPHLSQPDFSPSRAREEVGKEGGDDNEEVI